MLGRAIKEYIDENGIKQKKVAEDAGMKPQTLNDILNCRRKVEAMQTLVKEQLHFQEHRYRSEERIQTVLLPGTGDMHPMAWLCSVRLKD